MNLLNQILYVFPYFFMLYLLYEIVDYKRTKAIVEQSKKSIMNNTPLSTEHANSFLVDFIAFVWVLISVLSASLTSNWTILYLSIGIMLVGFAQTYWIVKASNNDKNVVIPYYVTTIILFGLFASIILIVNPLDLL